MQDILDATGLFASSKKHKRDDPLGTFMGNNFENKQATQEHLSEIRAENTQMHADARDAIKGNTAYVSHANDVNRQLHADSHAAISQHSHVMQQRQAQLEQRIGDLGDALGKTPSQVTDEVHGIYRYIAFLHESLKLGFENNNKYYNDILTLMHNLMGLMDTQIAREIEQFGKTKTFFHDILAANKSNMDIIKEDFDLNKHNTQKLDDMNHILESILSKLNVPDKSRNDRTGVDHLLSKLSINRRLTAPHE